MPTTNPQHITALSLGKHHVNDCIKHAKYNCIMEWNNNCILTKSWRNKRLWSCGPSYDFTIGVNGQDWIMKEWMAQIEEQDICWIIEIVEYHMTSLFMQSNDFIYIYILMNLQFAFLSFLINIILSAYILYVTNYCSVIINLGFSVKLILLNYYTC